MSAQQDTHRLSPSEPEVIRQKAVDLVLTGKKQVQAAKLLGVSDWSVGQWMKKYRQKGRKSLENRKRGTHTPNTLLKPNQERVIYQTVCERHPDEEGLPFSLWTREAIQKLIFKKYGIQAALRTMTDYLKRWGMTPQKPVAKAYEQKPESVRRWLEEEYPQIKARAKKEKGLIFWEDEMGLRSDHVSGRSFSPKGKTPVLEKTGKRFSYNMISAINNSGRLHFSIFGGSFNTPVYLRFLARLIRQHHGKKVFLIVDGHPVHRGTTVQTWLQEHVNQIECFYLPGYSPDLNPDEFLNNDIKETLFKAGYPRDEKNLKAMLKGKLYQIQKDSARIVNFFKAPSVLYAAA